MNLTDFQMKKDESQKSDASHNLDDSLEINLEISWKTKPRNNLNVTIGEESKDSFGTWNSKVFI